MNATLFLTGFSIFSLCLMLREKKKAVPKIVKQTTMINGKVRNSKPLILLANALMINVIIVAMLPMECAF